jgi:6-pyruvoyltetrahydropterin/6-carboxytetrahydropterin synthase
MRMGRVFYFDAAHFLPDYKGKCEQLHGHTYTLEVVLEDEKKEDGMVLDFNELKNIIQERILDRLDHSNMNEIFENPTAENIVEWIFKELDEEIPLKSVRLWEGRGKWVEAGR